jgi:hypothetical protein
MPYDNLEESQHTPNNWHIDNYGDKMEQSHGYVNQMRQCSIAYPTINERLQSYIPRLRKTLHQNANVSYNSHINPKMWYTHKLPQGCFICTSDSIANISLDVLEQTIETQPKLQELTFLQYKNTGLKLQVV